jgi:hypothetical protein
MSDSDRPSLRRSSPQDDDNNFSTMFDIDSPNSNQGSQSSSQMRSPGENQVSRDGIRVSLACIPVSKTVK